MSPLRHRVRAAGLAIAVLCAGALSGAPASASGTAPSVVDEATRGRVPR